MGRLEPETECPIGAPVEYRTHGQQLADPVGPFVGEYPYRLGIGEAVPAGERVGGVQARAVARPQGHRDPALGPGSWHCRSAPPW